MVLIADQDHFSNSTLSLAIRKLGLARNVICTTSATQALAYLHKQKTNSYPFPDLILYNPNAPGMNPGEFLKNYENHFACDFESKLILLRDKGESIRPIFSHSSSEIGGYLKKPVSTGQLIRIFSGQEAREMIG